MAVDSWPRLAEVGGAGRSSPSSGAGASTTPAALAAARASSAAAGSWTGRSSCPVVRSFTPGRDGSSGSGAAVGTAGTASAPGGVFAAVMAKTRFTEKRAVKSTRRSVKCVIVRVEAFPKTGTNADSRDSCAYCHRTVPGHAMFA
ncbi:hypothetical protein ACSNN9_24025 [Micromonospora sp. URMC 107]|uniref:hypothetical protein n=1 Tax=Micromonospora sp. URMC 107 TaxID=3423418 RepID=UPI003F1D20AA